MANVVTSVGRRTLDAVEGLGRVSLFARDLAYWMFTSLPPRRAFVPILYEVGVRSLPVVLVTGTFIGMVLAVQMYGQLYRLQAQNAIGMIINLSMVKEMGPVLAAVILAGRVGGAMAAELGTMRVTEQIDALSVMGANPIRYLILPRFLAMLILTPLLTVFSDGIGVFAGWLVSCRALGIPSFFYWENSRILVDTWDVWMGVVKSVVFGGLIGLVACYKGYYSKSGAEGVGRATTMAFVASFIGILVANFFLAVLMRHLYKAFVSPTGLG